MANQSFEAVLGVQIPPFHQCVFAAATKKKHSRHEQRLPELTCLEKWQKYKKSKTRHNVSQSSCSDTEFCKLCKNKYSSTKVLQKKIQQVIENHFLLWIQLQAPVGPQPPFSLIQGENNTLYLGWEQ